MNFRNKFLCFEICAKITEKCNTSTKQEWITRPMVVYKWTRNEKSINGISTWRSAINLWNGRYDWIRMGVHLPCRIWMMSVRRHQIYVTEIINKAEEKHSTRIDARDWRKPSTPSDIRHRRPFHFCAYDICYGIISLIVL